ncbi:MAG: dephospho-CoA kinase [bacterium]
MLAGLTGNFGSGKSTVLELFRRAGAVVVDSDEIVRILYEKDDVKREVVEILGDVLKKDGSVDKAKIAYLIFTNALLKKNLEVLIHALVFSEIESIVRKNPHKVVIAEIPLLFESSYHPMVDAVILTTCSRETIFERLRKKGYTDAEIEERLSNQMPDADKIHQADFVINTEGSPDQIKKQAKSIYTSLLARLKD